MEDLVHCDTRLLSEKLFTSGVARASYWVPESKVTAIFNELWQWPCVGVLDEPAQDVGARFCKLADEWSNEVGNISSLSALTSHQKYREIVKLGWDVVPFLLLDLQRNHRFWLPALQEITRIRPFDPSDSGNYQRMTEAWVEWGKKKRII
jgi:hypothetical protein